MSDQPSLSPQHALAFRLSRAAALQDIRLFRSTAEHHAFPQNGDLITSNVNVQPSLDNMDGTGETAAFFLEVTIATSTTRDEAPVELATFSAKFGAAYGFKGLGSPPSFDELGAFGDTVASMTLWPYLRAHVHNMARDMELEVLLPILRPNLAMPAESEDEQPNE